MGAGEHDHPQTLITFTNKLQLQSSYNTVSTLKNTSGFTWLDTDGCGVTSEFQSLWHAYVAVGVYHIMDCTLLLDLQKHPQAKPFATTGFQHNNWMSEIMPRTVQGAHAFRPSQQTFGSLSTCLPMV